MTDDALVGKPGTLKLKLDYVEPNPAQAAGRIFKAAGWSRCPECGGDNITHDHKWWLCLNEDCDGNGRLNTATRPLNAERIITLNCGVGRDSMAMLCLVIEGKLVVEGLGVVTPTDLDCVVFSNTGCEWQHTYDAVEPLKAMCLAHGIRCIVLEKGGNESARSRPPASWRSIGFKAALGGYHLRSTLMADYQSRATVASLGKGDCTDNHKIQPIRRLLNDISIMRFGLNNRRYSNFVKRGERQPHITIIGIAADETSRLANGGKGPRYVTEAYPLVTMGIAKPDEAAILARHDLNHIRKSGCVACPYQPMSWYWALRETNTALWDRVVEYERVAMERNPRMAATGAKGPGGVPMTIPDAVEKWRSANPSATVDAVLDKNYSRDTKEARAMRKDESAIYCGNGSM
jgi:hypothetical protein